MLMEKVIQTTNNTNHITKLYPANFNPAEFSAIFGSHGTTIPGQNFFNKRRERGLCFLLLGKPNSKVITKTFTSEEMTELFGEFITKTKVPLFSRPRNFQKQYKQGSAIIKLGSARCTYSLNLEKAKFVFSVLTLGDDFGW